MIYRELKMSTVFFILLALLVESCTAGPPPRHRQNFRVEEQNKRQRRDFNEDDNRTKGMYCSINQKLMFLPSLQRNLTLFEPDQGTKTTYLNQGEKLPYTLNPTYYRPFGATSDIGGAQCTPPISYASSTCAIVMKLSDKQGAHTNFQSSNVYCLPFVTS